MNSFPPLIPATRMLNSFLFAPEMRNVFWRVLACFKIMHNMHAHTPTLGLSTRGMWHVAGGRKCATTLASAFIIVTRMLVAVYPRPPTHTASPLQSRHASRHEATCHHHRQHHHHRHLSCLSVLNKLRKCDSLLCYLPLYSLSSLSLSVSCFSIAINNICKYERLKPFGLIVSCNLPNSSLC